MSRKNKAAPAQARNVQDASVLALEAETALSRSRYKEACELYKELLKRERRVDWIDGLAAGYAGRAESLAAKGMFKEALVLWRSRADQCGKPLLDNMYASWLAAAGERAEMLRLLSAGNVPEPVRAMLEAWLAPVVLASVDHAVPRLPAESALLRQRAGALAALAAYQAGDDAELARQLQAIPFRSPYRDLKTVLKVLAQLQADPDAAREGLARLAPNGPFEPLAAPARAALLPGAQWLMALASLPEAGRRLLLDFKGCPDAVRPLLIELARLAAAEGGIGPHALYDVLVKHRKALPAGVVKALCVRLLPHTGNRLRHYGDVFGAPDAILLEQVVALARIFHQEKESAQY